MKGLERIHCGSIRLMNEGSMMENVGEWRRIKKNEGRGGVA